MISMGKLRATWQYTDIPRRIKTELWRVIRDNPTQKAREQAIANLKMAESDDCWVRNSRDTSIDLERELLEMTEEEIAFLPEDLQPWARSLEGRDPVRPDFVKMTSHQAQLVACASWLVDDLRLLSRSADSETVLEYAQKYDEWDFIGGIDEPVAGFLLTHVQSELPVLNDLKDWGDLRIRDITTELVDHLSARIAQGEFKGRCLVCTI